MTALYFLAIALADLLHPITVFGLKEGCSIEVNGVLPNPQPLFLLPDGSNNGLGFLLPKGTDGIVNLKLGDRITVACPGAGNYLIVLGTKVQVTTAMCCSGGRFCIGSQSYPLVQLNCTQYPSHVSRIAGDACYDGTKKHLEIGFEVLASNNFFKLMDICFDDIALTALYSKYDVVSSIVGFQNKFKNPDFSWDLIVFKSIVADKYYKRNKQNETIGQLLGSKELGNKYISSSTDYFLSKGHLAPRAGFTYEAQQRATFHYINVAPQWQCFNGGSWKELEETIREFASNKNMNLVVYTGTYGIATLPNVNNVPTELYLYTDENNNHAIPVPAFYWKVLYDPVNQTGIAFVGINNPYLPFISRDHILCHDVCGKTYWRTWDRKSKDRGFAYCCDVNDFRSKVNILPDFPVVGLLGSGGSRQYTLEVYHVFLFLLSVSVYYKI